MRRKQPGCTKYFKERSMRAKYFVLLVAASTGCGKIDTSRSHPNLETSPPAVSRSGETTPGPATDDATSIPRSPVSGAPSTAVGEGPIQTAPDNTGVNARDTNRADRNPKLPIDQKEN